MKSLTTFAMLAIAALLCGCADDHEPGAGGLWKTNLPLGELDSENVEPEQPVADRKEVAADRQPVRRVEPMAGFLGAGDRQPPVKPPAARPRVRQQRPATVQPVAKPIVRRPPIAATTPVARAPKTKPMYGVNWHTSVNDALQSADKPGEEKPVMCFRVLGSLSGFM